MKILLRYYKLILNFIKTLERKLVFGFRNVIGPAIWFYACLGIFPGYFFGLFAKSLRRGINVQKDFNVFDHFNIDPECEFNGTVFRF